MWNSDEELFALMRAELFTAVVGDVMDAAGRVHQFLPREIKPLEPSMVVAGRAMPVLEVDCAGRRDGGEKTEQPFGLMFDALDNLKPNEVYLCTGASPEYALWGELMSVRAKILGAAGAVVNGPSRDTNGILAMGFPTFSAGTFAQDQGVRGRVINYRCDIEFHGGVRVSPGDLVFGDRDGVVVVPREIEAQIIPAALEKVRGENKVREAIEGGMSAGDAFKSFGIM